MHRAFLICSIALLGSCSAGRHDLFVDIKTDLQIPSDFVAVELTVTRPGATEPLANEVVAAFELEGDLLSGVRIGELLALEPGGYVVQVELRDSIGGLVIARGVAVNLQNDLVLTVVITRDCLGVVCPGTDDDAEETECLAGRCVVPECDPELTPELCGDSICSATTPCPAHATACLIGACSDGVCLYAPQDSACGAGERCEVDFGCTSGCTLAMCDDGNPCTDDSCSGDACENAPNTAACDDGVFCNGSDTCAAGACTQHDGDPCVAPTSCEEARSTCVGCTGDLDCPARIDGAPGPCAGFMDTCDEAGTQSRTVTTFACVMDTCEPSMMAEMLACMRSTAGTACGPGGARCAGGDCDCPGGESETICDDALDGDCDGSTDCGDDDCDGRPCGMGGRVCGGGVCSCPGGATETACGNGADDDCDGMMDCADPDCDGLTCGGGGVLCSAGACACAGGPSILVSGTTTTLGAPAVGFGGTEFAVVYMANTGGGYNYHLTRVTERGTLLASSIPLTTSSSVSQPAKIAFSGTHYGLAWSDSRSGSNDAYFRRFAPDGTLAGSEQLVDGSAVAELWASVAWDPGASRFAVVYQRGSSGDLDPTIRLYDSGSGPVGGPTTIANTSGPADFSHSASIGTGFVTAWHELNGGTIGIYYSQIVGGTDPDGPVLVSDGGAQALRVEMAWNGTDQVGMIFEDLRHGPSEIYFAAGTRSGTVSGGNVRVTNTTSQSTDATIVWNGTGYSIAWIDDRSGTTQVWFQELSAAGTPMGVPMQVSCAATGALAPSLTISPSRYGVAWLEVGSPMSLRFASFPR